MVDFKKKLMQEKANFKKQEEVFPFAAFLTGSQVYGNPQPDSDLDMVILCSPKDRGLLVEHGKTGKEPIQYGNLNIIATCDERRYSVWKKGTEELKASKEVGHILTREQAIEFFDRKFAEAGLSKSEGDSGEYKE